MRLLIAIPVFNERKYVNKVLQEVQRFAGDILFVDDGSTDGTAEFLSSRRDIKLVRHAVNRGYGQSVIDAVDYAHVHGFEWIITMDCDEQHEPERIPDFISQIKTERWDIISGSRYVAASPEDDLPPGDRRAINATITATLNQLFGWNLTDAFCGFKAHRVAAMKRLRLDEPGYAFPMQFWPRAYQAGLRITEIPVRLIYNDPNRHFGGQLDDASFRLKHYQQVLAREVESVRDLPGPGAIEEVCACCHCD